MKNSKPIAHACTRYRGRFIAFTLFVGGLLALGAHAAPAPQSVLTLYQTVDNNTEPSCSFDVPDAGSGTTVHFYPRNPDGQCKGNDDEEDKLFQPHSIRIRNAPAATRFLLSDKQTDQNQCSKADASNWIELETTRPLSSLEKMGLDKITDYRGYITNVGSDSSARSIGFKLVDHQGTIPQGKLSCIAVTTSAGVSGGSK